ncbi:MAG: hypothetical protein P4M09_02880 [Devosia sp.]|nr:hypothetical protein [Devosia sp.]
MFEAESGLAYNWHREYDPTTGSYIQLDPLGLASGAFAQVDAVNDNGGSLPAGLAGPATGTDLASLVLGDGGITLGNFVQAGIGGLRDPAAPWFQRDGNLSTSRFAYASNDPLQQVDPTGLATSQGPHGPMSVPNPSLYSGGSTDGGVVEWQENHGKGHFGDGEIT